MPDHVIIQVRDAVIARLKTAATVAGNNVFRKDEEPQDDTLCPFIMVECGGDTAERDSLNGGNGATPSILEMLDASTIIHCVVKQSGDAEQAAYNLRGQVEAALLGSAAALTLDGKVQMTTRRAAQPRQDVLGDLESYAVALQFQHNIWHLESQPTSFGY